MHLAQNPGSQARRLAASASLLLVLAGCVVEHMPAGDPVVETQSPMKGVTPVPVTESFEETVAPAAAGTAEGPQMHDIDPALDVLVQQALGDLAQQLSIPVEEIEVLSARSVVWPDGSLGCPRPGMVYPQVQVDGVRIELQAGERVYSYHGGGRRSLFLCEAPA